MVEIRRWIPLAMAGAIAAAAPFAPAQSPDDPPPTGQEESTGNTGEPRRLGDPWEAFTSEDYGRALQGFVDKQVTRPEDPALALNVGATHYRMNNWTEAEKAFAAAAYGAASQDEDDRRLRAEAFYNLGNVAYRQGKLEEAVERYMSALESDPEDEDAKFNLEFVRDEIRRRVEEAQNRQQQGGEQQQQQPEDSSGDGSGGEGEQQQQQGGEDDNGEQPRETESDPPPGQDSDGDALPDETERTGENPTDPVNPDSDRDGLSDGQEDTNRNGRVDPGETDPNRADTDGDGTGDAAEAAAAAGAAGAPQDEPLEGMTREEAERFLQAIEEHRPDPKRRVPRGSRTRQRKDW